MVVIPQNVSCFPAGRFCTTWLTISKGARYMAKFSYGWFHAESLELNLSTFYPNDRMEHYPKTKVTWFGSAIEWSRVPLTSRLINKQEDVNYHTGNSRRVQRQRPPEKIHHTTQLWLDSFQTTMWRWNHPLLVLLCLQQRWFVFFSDDVFLRQVYTPTGLHADSISAWTDEIPGYCSHRHCQTLFQIQWSAKKNVLCSDFHVRLRAGPE